MLRESPRLACIGSRHAPISASLPDNLASGPSAMSARPKRSRADIVRRAIERHLDDLDNLEAAAQRLGEPNDPMLDWEQVGRKLLDTD